MPNLIDHLKGIFGGDSQKPGEEISGASADNNGSNETSADNPSPSPAMSDNSGRSPGVVSQGRPPHWKDLARKKDTHQAPEPTVASDLNPQPEDQQNQGNEVDETPAMNPAGLVLEAQAIEREPEPSADVPSEEPDAALSASSDETEKPGTEISGDEKSEEDESADDGREATLDKGVRLVEPDSNSRVLDEPSPSAEAAPPNRDGEPKAIEPRVEESPQEDIPTVIKHVGSPQSTEEQPLVQGYNSHDIQTYLEALSLNQKYRNQSSSYQFFLDGLYNSTGRIAAFTPPVDTAQFNPIDTYLDRDKSLVSDVFDEIMPVVKTQTPDPKLWPAIVLIPFNRTLSHWQACEVLISKGCFSNGFKYKPLDDETYGVDTRILDPFGLGLISERDLARVRFVCEKRIMALDPGAKVRFCSIDPEHISGHHAYCAVILCEMLRLRLEGAHPVSNSMQGPEILLKSQAYEVKKAFGTNEPLNFPQGNGALSPFSGSGLDVEILAFLICSLTDMQMKTAVEDAIYNQRLYQSEPGEYVDAVLKALVALPTFMASGGAPLGEDDTHVINQITSMLYDRLGYLKKDLAPVLFETRETISEYEKRLAGLSGSSKMTLRFLHEMGSLRKQVATMAP